MFCSYCWGRVHLEQSDMPSDLEQSDMPSDHEQGKMTVPGRRGTEVLNFVPKTAKLINVGKRCGDVKARPHGRWWPCRMGPGPGNPLFQHESH